MGPHGSPRDESCCFCTTLLRCSSLRTAGSACGDNLDACREDQIAQDAVRQARSIAMHCSLILRMLVPNRAAIWASSPFPPRPSTSIMFARSHGGGPVSNSTYA